MFTVIIAEEKTMKLFEEFDMFLKPLLDGDKITLCEWNKQGETVFDMIPEIYEKVQFHPEWRAVIVNSDNTDKLNPFDFVAHRETEDEITGNLSRADFELRRKKRLSSYEKAINNPLTRLTTALSEKPVNISEVHDEDTYRRLVKNEIGFSKFVLSEYLLSVNTVSLAGKAGKYLRSQLSNVISPEKTDELIECIRKADVDSILSLVEENSVPELIRILSDNDPLYTDEECVERMVETEYKTELYETIAYNFDFKDRLPKEIICVSERTLSQETVALNQKRKSNGVTQDKSFTEWNLYPKANKYIVFDILPEDNKQYLFDLIRFSCFLLLLGKNEIPYGAVDLNEVYRAEVDFDSRIIEKMCSAYLAKLRMTRIHLKECYSESDDKKTGYLDRNLFEKLFETDATIAIDPVEYSRKDLYASSKGIGLSADCPEDEGKNWKNQYDTIERRFVKYLREPRRALNSAIKNEFHTKNVINDDRALLMNENQIEDMQMRVTEEEEKMIATVTTQLFNTAKYKKELKEADAEVRRLISRRMTQKKTLAIGGTVLLAYFVGFLPLLIKNINIFESFSTALVICVVGMALLALLGFLYLFSLRGALVEKISLFNHVIDRLCHEVEAGMARFSEYLAHACNIMRTVSALNIRESQEAAKRKILKYHIIMVDRKNAEMTSLFSRYVDCKNIVIENAEPFDYDYSVICEYDYKMDFMQIGKSIEYFQQDYVVESPVDFVDSVKVVKEEFYG